MREILFRAKRRDNGEWIYGYYQPVTPAREDIGVTLAVIRDDGFLEDIRVDQETVGQYIGLVDKNGNKIFEYDVCRFREWSNGEMCWVGAVCYEHQQFVISGPSNKECESDFTLQMSRFIPRNIEIIGNIYDNTDWLKGDEK